MLTKGSVAWFSSAKGYGFITPEAPHTVADDVFVHITDLQKSGLSHLAVGQRVTFEVGVGKTGRSCARNLALLEFA